MKNDSLAAAEAPIFEHRARKSSYVAWSVVLGPPSALAGYVTISALWRAGVFEVGAVGLLVLGGLWTLVVLMLKRCLFRCDGTSLTFRSPLVSQSTERLTDVASITIVPRRARVVVPWNVTPMVSIEIELRNGRIVKLSAIPFSDVALADIRRLSAFLNRRST